MSICRFYLIGIQFYQEVEHTQPKQLEHQAHMSPIIEPAEHFSTQARIEEKSMRIEWYRIKIMIFRFRRNNIIT